MSAKSKCASCSIKRHWWVHTHFKTHLSPEHLQSSPHRTDPGLNCHHQWCDLVEVSSFWTVLENCNFLVSFFKLVHVCCTGFQSLCRAGTCTQYVCFCIIIDFSGFVFYLFLFSIDTCLQGIMITFTVGSLYTYITHLFFCLLSLLSLFVSFKSCFLSICKNSIFVFLRFSYFLKIPVKLTSIYI